MTDADCPSLDCVHAPAISSPGQVIACLPHRVLVRLTGGEEGEVDAVAG
ncbi:MAG: NusG domain II-containing protein [Oscillospiraceae bacterium]|nr:NusG domain II-containing protein [Oscillospiraceae bacterium]